MSKTIMPTGAAVNNASRKRATAIAMIPTYNERENIELLLQEIMRFDNVEALVVDDNSPDGTWRVVQKLAQRNKRIHLLRRTTDKGRGLAGVAGFKWCLAHGAAYVIEMDADFSHDPKYIPALLKEARKYDVVLGSRFVEGGKDLDRGVLRQIITKLANFYIRTLLGLQIRDCTSGYRCFKRKVLQSINLDSMRADGPAIVQEVLYAAKLAGFSIKEIPIVFVDRRQGQSTLNLSALWRGLKMVLKLRFSPLFTGRKTS